MGCGHEADTFASDFCRANRLKSRAQIASTCGRSVPCCHALAVSKKTPLNTPLAYRYGDAAVCGCCASLVEKAIYQTGALPPPGFLR